ncbi:NAD(P)/FAD-dependent oxidoreductase [Dongia soli]|uniref:FAD-binding oxidoreductase n=1 Tax=Dongia soli TaxID=600628 RepID=A0ABU5EAB8_9PROT|nr:FAD-binding oxidoreductase [Dongia soli]MDY0882816.1 FAD-binding oxidoreductase [Dongia soli]
MISAYIDTYYKRSLAQQQVYSPLQASLEVETCVIGGGLAGLSIALELSRLGRSVALLEANRIAWGASGRNGGFVSPGYACDLEKIENRVGTDHARDLYRLSMEGVSIVAENIRSLAIEHAIPVSGIYSVIRYDGGDELQAYRDRMARDFGKSLHYVSRDELRETLRSPKYHQALYSPDSFHFHPLNYCQALAGEICRLGGHIYEETRALSIDLDRPEKLIRTATGQIKAQHVVFAGGGYTDRLCAELSRAYLPIATYVLLTERNPELIKSAIRTEAGIGDDRRAGDYYRVVDGGRLLWGGRITTRRSDPNNLAQLLRQEMVSTYPQLAELKVEIAWSGLMSYARHLMPQIGQLAPGIWHATAFGGHGMNTTSIGGRLIAEGIAGQSDRYRLFAPFGLEWNGGPFGLIAAQLTYWTYQLQDLWRERKSRYQPQMA